MTTVPSYPLMCIEWVDSYGCSSEWQRLETSDPNPLICKSVGWVIYESDTCVVIVPHMTEPIADSSVPDGCGDMTIPTVAIVSRRALTL